MRLDSAFSQILQDDDISPREIPIGIQEAGYYNTENSSEGSYVIDETLGRDTECCSKILEG